MVVAHRVRVPPAVVTGVTIVFILGSCLLA